MPRTKQARKRAPRTTPQNAQHSGKSPGFQGVAPGVTQQKFRQFVQDFYALSAGMQEVRRHMATIAGLTPSAYTTLMAITHLQSDNGVSVSDVARYLKLNGSTVTIEVGHLVDLNMVTKQPAADDRRKVLLALTPHAITTLTKSAPVWQQINGAIFDVLSPTQFDTFRNAVTSVLGQVEPALELADFLAKQSTRAR